MTVQPYDAALQAVNASGMSVSASIANADVSLTDITSYTLFRLKGNATDEGAEACNGLARKCTDHNPLCIRPTNKAFNIPSPVMLQLVPDLQVFWRLTVLLIITLAQPTI